MEVHVISNPAPCGGWDIEIRKVGFRLRYRGFPKLCREQAVNVATELAEFIGVPLVVEENVPRVGSKVEE